MWFFNYKTPFYLKLKGYFYATYFTKGMYFSVPSGLARQAGKNTVVSTPTTCVSYQDLLRRF